MNGDASSLTTEEIKIVNPEIQAIIDAWVSGDDEKAIALTEQYAIALKTRYCLVCNKKLAPQARGNYCKRHQHLDPEVKAKIKELRIRRNA